MASGKDSSKESLASVREFDFVTRTIFAPIYPVISGQIITRLGITRGRCLDLGTGPASLAIAYTHQSLCTTWALDQSVMAVQVASENIARAGLAARILPVTGDVHALPFADESADIIISRGSLFFWYDLNTAFVEIARVLKPGGGLYIGGGFGSTELKDAIITRMEQREPGFGREVKGRLSKTNKSNIKAALIESGLSSPAITNDIIEDETGMWVCLKKVRQV